MLASPSLKSGSRFCFVKLVSYSRIPSIFLLLQLLLCEIRTEDGILLLGVSSHGAKMCRADVGLDFSGEEKMGGIFAKLFDARMKMWTVKLISTLLLWIIVIQLLAIGEVWRPRLLKSWPSCSSYPRMNVSNGQKKVHFLPKRVYKNNGYLLISCNGGLNQMRAAICDMVAIARHLNATVIVPELDKTSFWADSSDFEDIFDVDHFILSLRDEVRILKNLPPKFKQRVKLGKFRELPPVSWSDISYYSRQILPLLRRHKVVRLNKTDSRLANNGLPVEIQKLRCKVNFSALRFTSQIEDLGKKVVNRLRRKGAFLALHLRYEMDMLSFSGCTQGCNAEEVDELTKMRYATSWWKEKIIDPELKRKEGLCPLTPEETTLVLKALGIDSNMQIYVAAGDIYGGERRLRSLASDFPNIVNKVNLLEPSEWLFFKNHSSQMAALDYLVSLESDVFVPTYDGNMAKVVEGHRRKLGFKKTILLDRRLLSGLIDQHLEGLLSWEVFSSSVKEIHAAQIGRSKKRHVIPEKPKEEDYFYANPQECLASK